MQKPQIDVRDKGFKDLPPLHDALAKVFEHIQPMDIESVHLRELSSYSVKILAEDVKAIQSVPNFTKSLMDGFAIRSEDVSSASKSNPVKLQVVQELLIYQTSDKILEKNHAIKIATGGVLPNGADAVVKIEDVIVYESSVPYTIEISEPNESGRHLASKGEDYKKDDIVFEKGRLLSAVDIGVLLTLGIFYVKCFKVPKIGIVSTGDEVIDYERNLNYGEVYDSNSYVLVQYLTQLGFPARRYTIIKDDFEIIKRQLLELSKENDIIITTGGTSVGKRDFTPLILNDLSDVLVHGISIKPGSPTTFGIKEKKYFLGLPGFPVSSFISFAFFGIPIILFLLGTKKVGFLKVKAIMNEDYNSITSRTDFLRVCLKTDNNATIAYPISVGGSSLLHTLSQSTGIVVIDDETEKILKNDAVDVVILDKLVNYFD